MSLLDGYLKKSHASDGRLPTIEECVEAIKNPETAKPRVKEYVEQRPELEELIRSILQED